MAIFGIHVRFLGYMCCYCRTFWYFLKNECPWTGEKLRIAVVFGRSVIIIIIIITIITIIPITITIIHSSQKGRPLPLLPLWQHSACWEQQRQGPGESGVWALEASDFSEKIIRFSSGHYQIISWNYPPTSNSDHQDSSIFSRESL